MAWRVARSLEVLTAEIRTLHPGTTVWTLGDAAHQKGWSDHNPNAAGVVCAADILGDRGLDLAWFAERVRTSGHPAYKYVIFDGRIASRTVAGNAWRPYTGSNPHASHVHVSVGVGPDGRSTGPYDDTSPWGLIPRPSTEEDDEMKMILIQDSTGIALQYIHPVTGELVWTNAVSMEAVAGWQQAGVPLVKVSKISQHGRNAADVAKEVVAALKAGGSGASAAGVADELAKRLSS